MRNAPRQIVTGRQMGQSLTLARLRAWRNTCCTSSAKPPRCGALPDVQSIGRSSVVHTQRGGTRCQAGWEGQRPGGLPPMLLPVAWPAVTLVDVPSTETE